MEKNKKKNTTKAKAKNNKITSANVNNINDNIGFDNEDKSNNNIKDCK